MIVESLTSKPGIREQYRITSEMGSFLFAMLSGALGAEISIIRRSPSMTDGEVGALVKSWWSVVIPLLTGAVMAGFLYIAFMAGILTGDGGGGLFTSNLFPSFTTPHATDSLNLRVVLEIRPVSVKDFGKLIVWCFLSGYSERLIPGLLASLEERGAGKVR
jgi:hypothetical protein